MGDARSVARVGVRCRPGVMASDVCARSWPTLPGPMPFDACQRGARVDHGRIAGECALIVLKRAGPVALVLREPAELVFGNGKAGAESKSLLKGIRRLGAVAGST